VAGEPDLAVEPLASVHDRRGFTCGVESLDHYLRTQAAQDMRRKAGVTYVMTARADPGRVIGYFTLSAFGVDQGEVPDAARKLLPRYPRVGATLIGRLAVDERRRGEGLGSLLLTSAIGKALANAAVVGSSMIVVDALDEAAARFYEAHGFVRLPDARRLILPMSTAARL
jgi:GNAT superfamily N-acetyltransferase